MGLLHHCEFCPIVQICRGAECDVKDKDGFTPLMLAAINRCENTFNEMVRRPEGVEVVRNTLLHLAQGQHQLPDHETTVSEHLKVSTHVSHMISDNRKIRHSAFCYPLCICKKNLYL